MASAFFGPCPHCQTALAFLVGVTGSQLHPKCPSCRVEVPVAHATFLMADHSQPQASIHTRKPVPPSTTGSV